MLGETADQHSIDCAAYPFEKIPRRVFLDTNVVDCLVKWSECVFENLGPPDDLPSGLSSDIVSLRNVFFVGSRATWDIVVSSKSVDELSGTRDEELRARLVDYGVELEGYGTVEEDRAYARDLARQLIDSPFLASLPHASDRELIAHAVGLQCDAFCTRDIRSIHRKRDTLRQIPLRILTPQEWWRHIRPWAGLWT